MTPLLRTKTSSTPVGAKLGGERRAAPSPPSCALWRGMGRLWRGMGGMGRPEPLSAHRPHQEEGLSGFHETRNTAFFAVGAQGTHNQKPPPGPPRTPPGHCFSARCGAAWGGYGAAWAAAVPPHRHTACRVFTSQGTRIMVIPCSSGGIKESNLKPDQRVFTNHETRNTNHGPFRISHEFPRIPTNSRDFPLFPGPPTPPRCPRAGLDLGRPRSKSRSLPLLPPSGLLPPPRTQQEPMFRKENVLDCVDITIGRGRLNRVK